jgi:hypothetical protein
MRIISRGYRHPILALKGVQIEEHLAASGGTVTEQLGIWIGLQLA